jgi:hypothetical protein
VRASRQGQSGRFGPARLVKILLAAAGAVLLAWWVVKTSSVDALVRRNPAAAAIVAPDHPRVRIALAMAEFRLRQGRLSGESRASVRRALAQAPLIEEPFYLAAIEALAAKRDTEAEALLHEARRRNPRARTARLILLDRHLRHNRVAEAGVEIAALNRLMPRAAEVLVPELARMVREPRTGAALIGVLAHEPALQQAVLAQLATSGADPDLILRIAGSNAATSPTKDGLPWQQVLLARLVERGDVVRAHRLWRSFSGFGPGGDEKGVYDGRFEGQRGAPPFNWLLVSGAAGVAERTGAPALEVEYYGRLNVDLASQLLMLRPGRYRLQFRAEGDAKGEGSRLLWSVSCNMSKAPLLSLPLTDIDYAPRAVAGTFTVPAGCPAQWLKLSGVAGEFANAQNATISEIRVTGGGAS